ncbi:hypothetical protein SAY87_028992 [Trapa incisa]|uniref:Uncharacterized protein n=1 Tax=Trapa incisa TaxID=236973 RepID=A0AAN7QS61_9MYRT|nr:hypothetical protein SAY87_028992 [Trapa incisa]
MTPALVLNRCWQSAAPAYLTDLYWPSLFLVSDTRLHPLQPWRCWIFYGRSGDERRDWGPVVRSTG